MSLGSSRNHLSYYLLFKLCSLLSTIFISSPTFRDPSVLSDNDPPCTILVGVLVSKYKREVFAIKTRGYLLQVLPVRVPDCNISYQIFLIFTVRIGRSYRPVLNLEIYFIFQPHCHVEIAHKYSKIG